MCSLLMSCSSGDTTFYTNNKTCHSMQGDWRGELCFLEHIYNMSRITLMYYAPIVPLLHVFHKVPTAHTVFSKCMKPTSLIVSNNTLTSQRISWDCMKNNDSYVTAGWPISHNSYILCLITHCLGWDWK